MSTHDDPLLEALGELAREAPPDLRAATDPIDADRVDRFTRAARSAAGATGAPPPREKMQPPARPARRGVLVRVAFGLAPLAAAAAVVLALRAGRGGGPPPLEGYAVEAVSGDALARGEARPGARDVLVLGVRDDAPVVVVLRPEAAGSDAPLDVRAFSERAGEAKPLVVRVETSAGAVRVETSAGALRGADALLVDLTASGAARRARVPVRARAAP